MNQLTLLFMGPQGSGKGTQIELLKAYLAKNDPSRSVIHFEMGKNLRLLAEEESYTGRATKEIVKNGELIPYAISSCLFTKYLIDHLKTGDEHIIIDGFPRTATQITTLDSALVDFYKRTFPTLIYIAISDEEAVKRLLLRARHDDTEATIRKRLEWSRKETLPTVEWFKNNGAYRVLNINGEQTVSKVHEDVIAALSHGHN